MPPYVPTAKVLSIMKILAVGRAEKIEAIRQASYFSGLDDELIKRLSEGASLRRYQRGEVLFWADDPCASLHIIRRGIVKLFKTSQQGRELIINVIEEGATFNEVPVFDYGQNPVNAAALDTSDVWVIDAGIIRSTMESDPAMCRAVIANLTNNLRMLVGKVEELSFYQVTNRLARLISQMPEDQLIGLAPYRMTQDQMAAHLGTVREVVARSLCQLERSGAIKVSRGQIEILDEEVLYSWVQLPSE